MFVGLFVDIWWMDFVIQSLIGSAVSIGADTPIRRPFRPFLHSNKVFPSVRPADQFVVKIKKNVFIIGRAYTHDTDTASSVNWRRTNFIVIHCHNSRPFSDLPLSSSCTPSPSCSAARNRASQARQSIADRAEAPKKPALATSSCRGR